MMPKSQAAYRPFDDRYSAIQTLLGFLLVPSIGPVHTTDSSRDIYAGFATPLSIVSEHCVQSRSIRCSLRAAQRPGGVFLWLDTAQSCSQARPG